MIEQAFLIDCDGTPMTAILAMPPVPASVGVVIVVGGPQTRVGSHRQFVLLARALAVAGVPCLRFDYRGMGDSSGEQRDFERVADDIGAAVASLRMRVPSIKHVVLWGLCDGATASAFYAAENAGVSGLVMLNPWVRTTAGEAAALVSNYYGKRFMSADFWRKLLSGEMDLLGRLREFVANWRSARARNVSDSEPSNSLPDRLGMSLARFGKPILLITSGNDFTAAEFLRAAESGYLSKGLARCQITRHAIEAANHTFSSTAWRAEVENATSGWLSANFPD